jgi:SAM-dependent methyltransferase
MNWRHKARLQSILSQLPGGAGLDYMMKRYMTKTVPATDATFEMDVAFAREHLKALTELGPVAIEEARFFEFGAGWDLTIAQVYYCCGVDHQLLADVRQLMKPRLVSDVARRLCVSQGKFNLLRVPEQLTKQTGYRECRRMLAEVCGIEYRAPFDARYTGLRDGAIDYITATKVLPHIPVRDLRAIVGECYRILRPGGLMRVLSSYRDEYALFDKSISVYNFLQFSEAEWQRYSTTLLYQNRLRHCDYRAIFTEAGFEILDDQPGYDGADEQLLHRLRLAEEFGRYSFEDLSSVRGVLLIRRPVALSKLAAETQEKDSRCVTGN